MKRKLAIITLAFAICFGCSKDVKPTEMLQSSTESKALRTSIYSDPDWQSLQLLSLQLVEHIPNYADLRWFANPEYAIIKGVRVPAITAAHFIYTVKQLGFTDTTAFRAFQRKQKVLQDRLHAKYYYVSGTGGGTALSEDLTDFIDPCSAAYSSCIHDAAGSYSRSIVECTVGAVAFGAAGAGIAGLLFQVGCGAYFIYALNTSRADCANTYQGCRGH